MAQVGEAIVVHLRGGRSAVTVNGRRVTRPFDRWEEAASAAIALTELSRLAEENRTAAASASR